MTALRWTPALVADLERCIAAGLPYKEIGDLFAVSPSAIAAQASARGFNRKYPRDRHGRLQYQAVPLDAPRKALRVVDHPGLDDRDLPKRRRCLACGGHFPSAHAGNRICPTCSPEINKIFDPATVHAATGGKVYG